MSNRRSAPISFVPIGLSDAIDATDEFPGAMMSLADLIPDPSTKGIFQCRPAATLLSSFASFSSPGLISVFDVVGSLAYGLVASNRFPGFDEPFCYDLKANAFLTISGVTAGNVPVTQSALGDWVPPTVALVGTKLVVTHPGFVPTTNKFGWFETLNPAALSWAAGNTAVNGLPLAPVAVAQFNGRAYYLVNNPSKPGLYASDALDAITMTNASYILTFGDNLPLTALAGLPLNNQLGGIIQSVIVFKGAVVMHQVTGDPAPGSAAGLWGQNTLNVATGTLSPQSIVSTNKGLAFLSPEGLRFIDFTAKVSDPIGISGQGVTMPFVNVLNPTRSVAAANASIIRISVQNNLVPGSPSQEFWYDMPRGIWTGPHSFPSVAIDSYGETFIIAPQKAAGTLFQSDVKQNLASVFIENNVQLTWTWQTCMMADMGDMAEHNLIETTIHMAMGPTVTGLPDINIFAFDQDQTQLDQVALPATGISPQYGTVAQHGTNPIYGVDKYGGQRNALAPQQVSWHYPLTYRRLSICATGTSVNGFKVGRLLLRSEALGYLQL